MNVAVLPPFTEEELVRRAMTVAVDALAWPRLQRLGIDLRVRRDDQLDRELSGNKFYKLFFNLAAAHEAGMRQIASFGGAYSNHLHALAAAGRRYGFSTLGLVRGERPAQLSPTLADAEAWGMRLVFLSRSQYRQGADEALMCQLREVYGDFYLVPEGGANLAGARGLLAVGRALEQQLQGEYDQVCLPCGTGTSLAGLAAGLPPGKLAVGISVLKGEGGLCADVAARYRELQSLPGAAGHEAANWRLISGYHGGGYARRLPPALGRFWREFEAETGLLVDPVYTLKLFWAVAQLAEQGYWRRGTRLVVVHTGGLQGRRGFTEFIS